MNLPGKNARLMLFAVVDLPFCSTHWPFCRVFTLATLSPGNGWYGQFLTNWGIDGFRLFTTRGHVVGHGPIY